MSEKDVVIRWTAIDPLGNNVILKQSTYEAHILGDHLSRDANFRKEIENLAKQIVLNPIFIVRDNNRNLYYSLKVIDGNPLRVKAFKVVSDIESEPNEVVTWVALRKGDKIENGVKIYERGDISDK